MTLFDWDVAKLGYLTTYYLGIPETLSSIILLIPWALDSKQPQKKIKKIKDSKVKNKSKICSVLLKMNRKTNYIIETSDTF